MSKRVSKDEPSPVAVLKEALHDFEKVTLSFSGAEDVVLIDMASRLVERLSVFSLDTGRLHPETLRFIDQVRQHYATRLDLTFDILSPDALAVEKLVTEKGLFSFYTDGHQECCQIRKVAPLQRHLAGFDAWITGQRRDQSPTRTQIPQRQVDDSFAHVHAHADAPVDVKRPITKFNPLAAWQSKEVWDYIRDNQVPYNELHDRGFISIGCAPCTRAVLPNEHERAGRWWWEEATQRECGLHLINLDPPSDPSST